MADGGWMACWLVTPKGRVLVGSQGTAAMVRQRGALLRAEETLAATVWRGSIAGRSRARERGKLGWMLLGKERTQIIQE